jgi:maleylacetate reductase
MRQPFTYTSLPCRVLFDAPAAATVADEVARLKLSRVLLVRSPGDRSAREAQSIAAALGDLLSATFADALVHVPIETLEACVAAHTEAHADGIVAIGGGSAIGLGKLVAAATKTPLVAVPTTYSGAELTPFNAVTDRGQKVQRRDLAMVPAAIVYDPDLTLSLPMSVTGPSMMNAIAHAIEGMYAPETNPIVAMKADLAIRLAAGALPRVAANRADRPARCDLLMSAMLAGEVLAVTSMALHHKLCHVLGGGYDLPHADVNGVILPYAMGFNAPGAPVVAARVASALGVSDAAAGLYDLARTSSCPPSLAALGLPETALEAIARTAAGQTYANPVPLTVDALSAMLADAFVGRRPTTGAYANPPA